MNKIFRKLNLLIIIGLLSILLSANYTFAANKTWNGSTSSDWNVGENWDGGNVPAAGDKAIIPTGLTNYPIITSGTVDIKDIKITGTGSLTISGGTFRVSGKIEFLATTSPYGNVTQSGGTLDVKNLKFKGAGTFTQSGSSLLEVSHDYKNSGGGTFNSTGGTIQFTGSGGNGPDFSTGTNQFFHVIINSGVDPKFDRGASGKIKGKIKVAGDFTNNNSLLDVTTAEFIFNGTSDQTIYSACNPVPGKNTFGKLTIDNPGTVTLLTDVEAKISFTLTQGELDLNGNKLYVNGEEYAGPLPVELSSFSAVIVNNGIKLNWRTETEVSNYGFDVERQVGSRQSAVGNWEMIGFVEGHGNSNSPKEYSFVDNNVAGGKYSYRLKQIDNDGKFEYSKVIEVDVGAPLEFELSQNYPNPFNPSTKIKFSVPVTSNVKLSVFNILGEEVQILVNETKEAGIHTINFSAIGGSAFGGNAYTLPSGIYFYKLETRNFIQVKKMSLLK
jgi:hypothetical protein